MKTEEIIAALHEWLGKYKSAIWILRIKRLTERDSLQPVFSLAPICFLEFIYGDGNRFNLRDLPLTAKLFDSFANSGQVHD